MKALVYDTKFDGNYKLIERKKPSIQDSKDAIIEVNAPAGIIKYEIRKMICNGLDINEYSYSDEEIFEMLKELWKTRIR